MRRLVIGVLVGSLLGLAPPAAQADHAGCQAIGNVTGPPVSCQYIADGAGTYSAQFATGWSITVIRIDEFGNPYEVVLANGSLQSNPLDEGEIDSWPGELVTVEIRRGVQSLVLGRVTAGHWEPVS